MKHLFLLFISFNLLFLHKYSCQSVYEGDNYDLFSGCVIQTLTVETYDPAGIRIYDTTVFNNSLIMRSINVLHKHTLPRVISRILRFTVGDTVEPFIIYESERLIRRLIEVRDCFIKIKFIPDETKRVSIIVVVQDRFSVSVAGLSTDQFWRIGMSEQNLAGRGQKLAFAITHGALVHPETAVSLSYSIPILGKQLFNLSGDYSSSASSGYRSLRFSRPFLTPLFKWGGGIAYGIRSGFVATSNPLIMESLSVQQLQQEAWLGRSVSLGIKPQRMNHQLIFSGAYNLHKLKYNNSEDLGISVSVSYTEVILGSVGYTLLHRYRKKYLFSFEQISDFTEGVSIFLTQGWINKFDNAHLYSGLFIQLAKQFKFGYLAASGNLGFRTGHHALPESASEIKTGFVSPLINLNRFKLRLALNGRFLNSSNKLNSTTLVSDNRSENPALFNGRILQSLSRASVQLRIVMYTPWKPFGADIAPFLYLAENNLRSSSLLAINDGWRSSVGLGVIFRHVKLAINVVRISFVFYPVSKSAGLPLYQFLPSQIFDLPPTDFESPQPRLVSGI